MSTASSAWHTQSWRNGLPAAGAVVMAPYLLVAHFFTGCSPVALIPVILAHGIPGFPLR